MSRGEELRQHLVVTRFQEDARFRATFIYPEVACREALVNAIAHRDYSEEGRGVELYIYDDRMEIKNPGGLLSSISVADIRALKGVHQSRNSYVARTLREIGIMRELGEGMRRIFELMKSSELAPPDIATDGNAFSLSLHHRAMYSKDEALWLGQYDQYDLTPEEKAVVLMGRRGDLLAPNDIIRRVGIVDTEVYRQIVYSLQTKGILESTIPKLQATKAARKKGVGARDIPRFKIVSAKDVSAKAAKPEERPRRGKKIGTPDPLDVSSIFVVNMPENTTEKDLVVAFNEFGTVTGVTIPRKRGANLGYAFVAFAKAEEMERALTAQITLGPRHLTVRRKLPRSERQRIS